MWKARAIFEEDYLFGLEASLCENCRLEDVSPLGALEQRLIGLSEALRGPAAPEYQGLSLPELERAARVSGIDWVRIKIFLNVDPEARGPPGQA